MGAPVPLLPGEAGVRAALARETPIGSLRRHGRRPTPRRPRARGGVPVGLPGVRAAARRAPGVARCASRAGRACPATTRSPAAAACRSLPGSPPAAAAGGGVSRSPPARASALTRARCGSCSTSSSTRGGGGRRAGWPRRCSRSPRCAPWWRRATCWCRCRCTRGACGSAASTSPPCSPASWRGARGRPCAPDALVRRQDTVPQAGLTAAARRRNVREAFAVRRRASLAGRDGDAGGRRAHHRRDRARLRPADRGGGRARGAAVDGRARRLSGRVAGGFRGDLRT